MSKEILNLEGAAALFEVSIKTFIKLLKEEEVPGRKIGREWRFKKEALIKWLSLGNSMEYSSSDSDNDTKEFYDNIAHEWEEIRKGYYNESVKNIILNSGLLDKKMKVVDIGSGSGYISRAIAESVRKVIAIDISSKMLKELELRAKQEKIKNIVTIEGNGLKIPISNDSIDIVCSNMYLHNIEDPVSAIIEMNRILKKGGTVFLADLYEHTNKELRESLNDKQFGFNVGSLKTLFMDNGFSNIEIKPINNDTIKKGKKKSTKIFILKAVKKKDI